MPCEITNAEDRAAILEALGVEVPDQYAQYAELVRMATYYPRITPTQDITGGVFNGAEWLDDEVGAASGFRIPAGVTGRQSNYLARFILGFGRSQSLIGKTARFFSSFEISEGALEARPYNVTTQAQRVSGTAGDLGAFSNVHFVAVSATVAVVSADYTFTGLEANINISIQATSLANATVESTIKPVSMHYLLLEAGGFEEQVWQVASETPEYIRTVVIKPDGSGDFVSIKAAIDDLGATGQGIGGMGVNADRRVKYEVHEGVYTDTEYFLPAFADIVGIGRRERIWLKGYLPANTATATIEATSTVWMNETTRIRNLTITCQNMRYPIHSDSSASAKRAVMHIIDCDIIHLGNDEARQWQTNNAGNPAAVWAPEHAWGGGSHSGQKIYGRRSKFVSGSHTSAAAFGNHTNKDFDEGNVIEIEDCELVHPSGGMAFQFSENGSKVAHEITLKGCKIDGRLNVTSGGYLTTSALVDHGNGTGMCRVRISGSSPVAWTSMQDNNVLELRGTAGATSSVAISGDAATVLFGSQPDVRRGGTNYAARIYSAHKINKLAAHGLAARLGDLSEDPLTLTVTLDDGSPVDLVLDADYSAMNNAAVISALNTLMSGAGGGATFYESTPYQGEAPVFQMDREITVQNTSTDTLILKGMAVAFDGGRHLGRIATSSDARKLIAGIALENIAPGQRGRLQKSGYIAQAQVLFSATPSIAVGDEFGVSATAGQLVEGASVPLLRAIDTPVFEIV